MRAAVLRAFGGVPEPAEVEVPAPGPDEVLVRVRAAGLCGTDLKFIAGDLPRTTVPRIPGHEVAGEIVTDPRDELAEGQRIACYMYESCGECEPCRCGRPTLCRRLVRIGLERDGGLAQYMALARENAILIGDSIEFEAAAVSMDSVLTPWHGLVGRAALGAGESALVVGAGGLGLNGVQIAIHLGARVAVIDPQPSHRSLALELGAELAVDTDGVPAVREWCEGEGVDVAVDTSGRAEGFRTAFAALKPSGRLVAHGYQMGVDHCFDSSRVPLEEISILGARVGTRDDARAALAAVAEGAVRPAVNETVPLERVGDALERLRNGDVLGRIVVDPWR